MSQRVDMTGPTAELPHWFVLTAPGKFHKNKAKLEYFVLVVWNLAVDEDAIASLVCIIVQ